MKRAILIVAALCAGAALAQDVGTAFTYQGYLSADGKTTNGLFDIEFRLYAAEEGGVVVDTNMLENVSVSNGHFAAAIDFGAVFDGSKRWLELAVAPAGTTPLITLNPRQELRPTPYSLMALNTEQLDGRGWEYFLNASNFNAGTLNTNLFSAYSDLVSEGYLDNSTGTDLLIRDQADVRFWQTGGNSGMTGGTDFIGTTDEQALDIRVNNRQALRVAPHAFGANILGGDFLTIGAESYSAAIGGGSSHLLGSNTSHATIGGGHDNSVGDNTEFGVVGGGRGNHIATNSNAAAIGGGRSNYIDHDSSSATIGGGESNSVDFDAPFATVGGGRNNYVGSKADAGTVGGGFHNRIDGNSHGATIGGGCTNTIAGNAEYATIPGGALCNVADGARYAFAAGRRAEANHAGSFVWADSADATFQSTATNQFLIRAGGGVGIGVNNPAQALHVNGKVEADGFIGSGSELTGLDASGIGGGTLGTDHFSAYDDLVAEHRLEDSEDTDLMTRGQIRASFWRTDGNNSTFAGTHFVGTVHNEALDIRVNEQLALRVAPHANAPNLLGGASLTVGAGVWGAAVSGGGDHDIGSNATYPAIGGGCDNDIGDNADYATISGGEDCNIANNADYALAAGRRAKAGHLGAFVWADSTDADFLSTAINQVNFRCYGGARFVTGDTNGVELAAGGGSWSSLSDRNVKENFESIEPREVLERVVAMPISTWNMKAQDDAIRHIGPMAQDFHAAFGLGESERHINGSDADGVSLAAIQGLYQMLNELRAENAELRARVDELGRGRTADRAN